MTGEINLLGKRDENLVGDFGDKIGDVGFVDVVKSLQFVEIDVVGALAAKHGEHGGILLHSGCQDLELTSAGGQSAAERSPRQ